MIYHNCLNQVYPISHFGSLKLVQLTKEVCDEYPPEDVVRDDDRLTQPLDLVELSLALSSLYLFNNTELAAKVKFSKIPLFTFTE